MNSQRQFTQFVEEIDFRLARRRHLRERGVNLIVTHMQNFQRTLCAPGEMIGDIAIGGQPHPRSLCLSHISLLLMDCFCRYRLPLTALRIEQIMNGDPFYVHYPSNRVGRNQSVARPDRKSVRVYIPRIWRQMAKVLEDAGAKLRPQDVLLAEATDLNTVTYQVKATCEVIHIPAMLPRKSIR